MADRTYRSGRDRYDRERSTNRQAEQFEPDYGWRDEERSSRQMGDSWRDDERSQYESNAAYGRERDAGRAWGRDPSYHPSGGGTSSYRRSSYGRERPGFSSFTGNDFGGRDFTTSEFTNRPTYPGGYGAGSQLAANHGEWRDYGATPSRENREYRGTWGDDDGRNWFDRATDKVAGWFSDDDYDDRRERGYRGRGPTGYTRSDERISEDACDALTEDWGVDASQISVSVKNGEVTLDGTVPSRQQKRRAEDCVDDISGVRHVQNNLRVQETSTWDRNNSAEPRASKSNPTATQA